ncbi:MAG: hypothetical protein C0467_10380 [Planctomycetaceae bacterium]|nr:hypothetical protein [Planctomycetaceae bacterium]
MRAAIGMAVVFVAGLGFAAEDKKEVKLEGTYLIVGIEAGGEKLPDEFVTKQPEAERTITIKGDKIIASKKDGKEDPATFKIDATKTPAEITITTKKPDKDETAYGIFKVEGDKLTICAIESEKATDRPKEFKTSKESKSLILILQRKKEK